MDKINAQASGLKGWGSMLVGLLGGTARQQRIQRKAASQARRASGVH